MCVEPMWVRPCTLTQCALTLEVQVPGSCGDLCCDFRVNLDSVEIAGVP